MARKFGEVKHPQMDFTKLKIRYLAEKKFGKTGFFESIDYFYRNKFGKAIDDFTVFIITLGSEVGDDAMYRDSIHVETYEDFIEVIDDIVENPSEYPPIIGVDTENQLIAICEPYIVSQYNREREDGKKRVKSINAAYGGFNKGQDAVVNEISNQLSRLTSAGKGVITTGHTKRKKVTDKVSEDNIQYEIVTSNLMSTYDNPFAAFADIIMVGTYTYELDDEDNIKSVNRIVNISQKSDKSVGSGSRYLGMPEFVTLETFSEGANGTEQFDVNLKNGSIIIDGIINGLRENARARGLVVTDNVDDVTSTTNVAPREKRRPQQNKVELTTGEELWGLIAIAVKDSPELKKQIMEETDASSAKSLKEMILNNNISKAQLKSLNKLVK